MFRDMWSVTTVTRLSNEQGDQRPVLARVYQVSNEADEAKAIARAEAAESRVADLERIIRGMFPMWIAAMGYCEHGKHSELLAMRNYYNGRDNPMTSDDIQLMLSLIQGKAGE